jgi:tellurite resistance protein
VGWWATSFPLAASAVAALRFAEAEPGWATDAIALALSALASVVIVWLLGRTVWGIARGELRQLSS